MPTDLQRAGQYVSDLFDKLAPWLAGQPELCIFLAIGLGYFIGQRKIGPVQLGGVCGTLLAALVLGQAGVSISANVKNFFFALFIFALGYAGGPQFFSSLNARGLRMGLLSLIEVGLVLTLALAAVHIFSFDAGTAAGLIAGSATESAVIGTASEAISRLPIAPRAVEDLQARVATAYSLTYIFGLITIVVFTSQIAPLLLRVNLRDEAAKLWEKLGGDQAADEDEGLSEMIGRVYRVNAAAGQTLGQLEQRLGAKARVEKISRRGRQLQIKPERTLKHGDLLLVVGHRDKLIQVGGLIGEERPATASLNLIVETEEYLVTKKGAAGLSLHELRQKVREKDLGEHVHFSSLVRNGKAMPMLPNLTMEDGDSLFLYGPPQAAAKVGQLVGRPVRRGNYTNFVYLGLGIVLGILIGRITIPLAGINLSLGTGGGALLTGLIFGWFRSKHSSIPGIPASSLEIMKDLGLSTFVACIGLSSGRQAVALVGEYGLVLPLVGVVMVLTPALVSLAFGRLVLKLEAPILLGAIAGQQCSTPALSAVQAAAGNTTPLVGYTITYALSNVLLPLLGPIIVGLAGKAAL